MFLSEKGELEGREFDFFVLCQNAGNGAGAAPYLEPIAYFSRNLPNATTPNTLNAIVVFPPHQRKGHSSLLIELSEVLARRGPSERRNGPERPFSDLGEIAYKAYWKRVLVRRLLGATEPAAGAELYRRAATGLCRL